MKRDLPIGSVELEQAMRPPLAFAVALPTYGVARMTVKRSPSEMRAAILKYERAVMGLPQTDLPVRHFYIEGRKCSHVYAREIAIPANVAAVGRVHKFETINIISKGRVIVASDEGVRDIRAPFTWVSKPGAKRALYAIEDLLWTTFSLTDELDAAKIKDDLGTVTYEEFLQFLEDNGHDAPRLPS